MIRRRFLPGRPLRPIRSIAVAGCLIASWLFLADLAKADEEPVETTIPRLEFRIVDAPPDGPVRSFRYSYAILRAGEEEPLTKLDLDYRSEDGVLRIPPPYPPFGRVRVWIEADDGRQRYREGYESFSYRIEATKPAELPTISLTLGVVLTGQVLDAETGKPLAGAEVAPMQWGHHFDWADWDQGTTTDREGKYRLAVSGAKGIAARAAGYRELEWNDDKWHFEPGYNVRKASTWSQGQEQPQHKVGPEGFVLRLQPLIDVRGRVVSSDGKPITDVSVSGLGGSISDADGRFILKVTREEWNEREKHKVDFYSTNHRSLEMPLKQFSLERETLVTLQPEQVIRGQVFDEHGKPLEQCQIELKQDSPPVVSDFDAVPGPYREGKWEQPIGEHDTEFTLRVSLGGVVRSVNRYTREEVTRGPIVTRLDEGRQVTGRLVAHVPLDEQNTPVVVLAGDETEGLSQQAKVQPDGRFTFAGLTDGKYTLRLYPPFCEHRGGPVGGGVGAFSVFGFDSPNKPWETSLTVAGRDVALDPIDLHGVGLLPGNLTGAAYQPADGRTPLANAFGFICSGEDTFDTVGGFFFLLQFMTDADGRFRVDRCPPGKYVVRLSDTGHCGPESSAVWIRVAPEKTTDLRLFAEADRRLSLRFVVGNGSPQDGHAGAALDPAVIAKYADQKTGELPFIQDDAERFRAAIPEILCTLEPLDESIDHWPIFHDRFQLSPGNLLKDDRPHLVVPNVSPGRWRLTLQANYDWEFLRDEPFSVREVPVSEDMAPLEIRLPAASLVGSLERPADNRWGQAEIEAIPTQPGLPTRTCRGPIELRRVGFRFIGLEPGEYTLRVRAPGCKEERMTGVIVEQGKTTWLDKIVLKLAAQPEGPAEEGAPLGPVP